jgi:hypothetical protein
MTIISLNHVWFFSVMIGNGEVLSGRSIKVIEIFSDSLTLDSGYIVF